MSEDDALDVEAWRRVLDAAAPGDAVPSPGQVAEAVADADVFDVPVGEAYERVQQAAEVGVLVVDDDAGTFGQVRLADAHAGARPAQGDADADVEPNADADPDGTAEDRDDPALAPLDVPERVPSVDAFREAVERGVEPAVWPLDYLRSDRLMLRKTGDRKRPWAPWADPDAPVECSRDHDEQDGEDPVTCAECGHSARYKWGSPGSREHVHADAETALRWRDRDPRATGELVYIQAADDPLLFVDGDDVRDPETGEPHPAFVEIVDALGVSYADVSQSGGGFHVAYRGTLPDDLDGKGQASWQLDDEPWGANDDVPAVEIYANKHVCVATGRHLRGTGTVARHVDPDGLRAVLDDADQLREAPDPGDVDRDEFDPAEHDPGATGRDETTRDARDVFHALDALDARRVADATIVHRWNPDASTSEGTRAFYPTWGVNSNGTANIVDDEKWQDTGDRGGYGGPAVMAAIDAGLVTERATPRDVDGETWVQAVEHLRSLGFDVPQYVGEQGDPDNPEDHRPDPRSVDVVVEPARAWDAAGRVTPGDVELDLDATADGEAWRCPACGERVGDVARAVALADGLVDACEDPLDDAYATAYDRARERGAPLPRYVTHADATDEYAVVTGAIAEATYWHLDPAAFESDVTATGDDVGGAAVRALDPAWRESASGESVLVFESGVVWDADTERTLDVIRFVALDAGLITDPAAPVEGATFTEAYRLARTHYGAPLPKWSLASAHGERDVTPMLPPADELVDEPDAVAVDRDELDDARRDVEALYRELATPGERDRPAVLATLPATGKTTSAVKTARDRPTSYLAPRKELQAQALAKAERWGASARVLPVFAEHRPDPGVLDAAVAHVREHGKDRLRDRWAVLDAVGGGPVFPDGAGDEDAEGGDLDRATCPTAEGRHGDAWALVVHVARALGYTPQDIHAGARGLFGAALPCQEHDHADADAAGECAYSRAWDRVSDPEAPVDLLVGSYGHAHVESVRTHYSRGPRGSVERTPRTVVLDEFPGLAFATDFGPEAFDHAVWLASALDEAVVDRRDLYERDLWADDVVRAWLDGQADDASDAVSRAAAALGHRLDVLDAVETAAEVLDAYTGAVDDLDLGDPLRRLVDADGLPDADVRGEVACELGRRVDAVRPDDDGYPVARWVREDVVDALDRVAGGQLDPRVDALPYAGEVTSLVERAVEASDARSEAAAGTLRAARDALVGGDDGARALAVWADDGYAHRDAHHLLAGVIMPREDERVSTVETSSFAFDPDADAGTRLDAVAVGDRTTVVVDRNEHGATLLDPPTRASGGGDDAPLVALDATARATLWSVVLGEDVDVADVHDTPRERARFLRDALGLQVVRTADRPRYYEGDPAGKDLDGDVALVEAIDDEFTGVYAARERGAEPELVGAPAVITAKGVRDVLEDDPRLDGRVAAWENYGNLTGANDLGEHRLGVLLGCQHYGDHAVEHLAALAGEQVDTDRSTGRGAALDYGSDVANAYLRHMREDQVMQATLRFTRGGSGATVYARTSALREDLPVVGEGRVVASYSDTASEIAREWRRLGGEFTASDVADVVDVTRRQVRRVLAEWVDAGYLDRTEHGPGRAHTYRPLGSPGAGEVEFPERVGGPVPAGRQETREGGGERDAPGRTPSNVVYTWNVRVATGGDLLDGRTRPSDPAAGRLPAPPGVEEAVATASTPRG